MELKTIQFIQTTPEHLQEAIVSGIRVEIDSLRREFQPKQPIQYLSRSDVKAMLGVDLSTIHNWTKRGKLKAYGLGNRVYYKRSEVEEAIKPLNS